MNGCEECIEYRFHHKLIEPSLCNGCGNITMEIVQNDAGYYHAECPICHTLCAWSDCTPCGGDDELWFIRNNNTRIYIEPQTQKVNTYVIIDLAKYFHINTVQMRVKLIEGELLEMKKEKMEEYQDASQLRALQDCFLRKIQQCVYSGRTRAKIRQTLGSQ